MSIGFQCPGCQRPYNVDDALAGKRVRCKQCGNEMRVPTPRRPAVASSPPKPRPQAVPADVYGLEDEPAEPMPAPVPTAGKERSASSGGGGLGGFFGSKSKKKKKRQSADDGPWGVQLRRAAFLLFLATVGMGKSIQHGAVDPFRVNAMKVTLALATLTMVASVLGALTSFLRGNRSAFRGESIFGQIAWAWTVVALGSMQFVALAGLTRGHREPVPLARTAQAGLVSYELLMEQAINATRGSADRMDQIQPGPNEAGAMELLRLKQAEIDFARDRARTLPLPTSDQVRQLKERTEGDFRAAVVRMRDAAGAGAKRFPAESAAAEYFRMMESTLGDFVSKYDQVYPVGSDHAGWYFAVFGKDIAENRSDPSAPSFKPPKVPEIPRELLQPPAPIVSPGPTIPPPNVPVGPTFGPGGPPSPPGMQVPQIPRPPGFPSPPPRPNFPRPPRFGPPGAPTPPGFQ